MALVFLVESIIGCFRILKGQETYLSGLFQPQKAARGCERSGPKRGLRGPDLELRNRAELAIQFSSVQQSLSNRRRRGRGNCKFLGGVCVSSPMLDWTLGHFEDPAIWEGQDDVPRKTISMSYVL